MLIISPYTYNEHGTLCNDGTLGLPLRKVFNHNFVVVAKFSLKNDLHLEYSFKKQTDPLLSILRRSDQFEWKLRRLRTYEHGGGFMVHENNWIYWYRYDSRFEKIAISTFPYEYENHMKYYVIIIESTSGHCTNKNITSHVAIVLKNGTKSVLYECGKLYHFREKDILELELDLSIYEIITIAAGSTGLELVDNSTNGKAAYNNMYELFFDVGIFFINGHSKCISLSFSKYILHKSINITISGKGSNRNQQFSVSVVLEIYHEVVHIFYITTHAKLSFPKSQHYTKTLITIRDSEELIVSYQPVSFKLVDIECNHTIQVKQLLYKCFKLIRAIQGSDRWLGSYNVAQNRFVDDIGSLDIEETFYGPTAISHIEAQVACVQEEKDMLRIRVFGHWMDSVITMTKVYLAHYSVLFWMVNFKPIKTVSYQSLQENCDLIQLLIDRQYILYTKCNPTNGCKTSRIDIMQHKAIIEYNRHIFCSQSNLPDDDCSVITPVDHFRRYVLLFIPCTLSLPQAGYVCESHGQIVRANTTFLQEAHPALQHKYPGFYQCINNVMLPNYYVCDGRADCIDGADESNCTGVCSLPSIDQQDCFTAMCVWPGCSCSDFYFQCEAGGCIPLSEICDCLMDCPDGSDERPYLCSEQLCGSTVGNTGLVIKSFAPRKDKGRHNHYGKCIRQTPYKLGWFSTWEICDGKMDCAYGLDEWIHNCNTITGLKSYLLRCPRDKMFVNLHWAKDDYYSHGKIQRLINNHYCKQSNDDKLEVYFNRRIPDVCEGRGLTLLCTQFPSPRVFLTRALIVKNPEHFPQLKSTKLKHVLYLHISHAPIPVLYANFQKLVALTKLVLHSNGINVIAAVWNLQNLYYLDLHNNSLANLDRYLFSQLGNIRYLNLSQNSISLVQVPLFQNNSKLLALDISHNTLTHFPPVLFTDLLSIQLLMLSHNPVPANNLQQRYVFDQLHSLQELQLVHEEICCLVQGVECTGNVKSSDMLASCSAIIDSYTILVIAYICAFLIICLNCISLVWNIKHNSQQLSTKCLHCLLNVCDCLMAVYIFIIITAHHAHERNTRYIVLLWKQTYTCKIAGVIMMTSVNGSNLVTLLIAIDRYICIVLKPFQRYGFSTKQAVHALLVCSSISVLLPVLSVTTTLKGIINSACVLLGRSLSVIYANVYATCNILTFTCIIVLYTQVICKVSSSLMAGKQNKFKHIAGRLSIIIVTNFIASMTVTILSILAQIISIPVSLETMLALVLFSLNACTNPSVNTIFTKEFISYVATFMNVDNIFKGSQKLLIKVVRYLNLRHFIICSQNKFRFLPEKLAKLRNPAK